MYFKCFRRVECKQEVSVVSVIGNHLWMAVLPGIRFHGLQPPSHLPNLTQTTWYQVYTDGGFCPSYFSDTAIVYVEPLVIPGLVSGSDSVCGISGNGAMTLNGGSGAVDHWEYSTDGGATWTTVANSTTTLNYSGVTTSTLYRVFTKGVFCIGVYSDTALLYVETPSDAGTLQSSDSVCPGGNYNLSVTGQVASSYYWESSVDGITWNATPNAGLPTHSVTGIFIRFTVFGSLFKTVFAVWIRRLQ